MADVTRRVYVVEMLNCSGHAVPLSAWMTETQAKMICWESRQQWRRRRDGLRFRVREYIPKRETGERK